MPVDTFMLRLNSIKIGYSVLNNKFLIAGNELVSNPYWSDPAAQVGAIIMLDSFAVQSRNAANSLTFEGLPTTSFPTYAY